MKTKVIVTLFVVFVWGLVASAQAQVVAGSPEDKAFQQIDGETNVDAKIGLLLQFEKDFPQSKTLREVYLQLMQIYQQRNEQAKIIEFAEKVIKIDADNLIALLTVTRAYAMDGKPASLDRAIQYGQRAVDQTSRLKGQPPQQGYTDETWKQYINDTDQRARDYLNYARSLKR